MEFERALLENRHEDRLDIYVASIKRTKKRKRMFGNEGEDGARGDAEGNDGARGDAKDDDVNIARQLAEERSLRKVGDLG